MQALAGSILFAQPVVRDIKQIGPVTEAVDFNGYGDIYYVSADGSDESGGGSSTTPWQSVNNALKTITDVSEAKRAAILVAGGSYKGIIEMRPYIDLFGGFDGKNWTRDIEANTTILDGENLHRVVIASDSATIDGFTISHGRAKTHGGGILCDDASPTISNCSIVENYVLEPEDFNHERIHQDAHHGAGIAVFFNSAPVIRNNVFYDNRTSIGNGAGVAFYGWIRIEGAPATSFEANVMIGGLQAQLKNNVFINNVAGENDIGRTRSSNGGAISCAYEARPIIENNVIAYNEAKGRSDAGGIYSEYYSYPTVVGNWLVGNIGDDDGGAIYAMRMGSITIDQNFIAGNWTRGGGVGGIRLSKEGRGIITNNIIVQNQTGGAVQCVDSYMIMHDNLVMHNKGQAISYRSNFSYFQPSVLEQNIIRENERAVSVDSFGGASLTITKNNIDEKVQGKHNKNKPVARPSDGQKLKSKGLEFDSSRYQTIIEVDQPGNFSDLVGRVVRINEFWSVICATEGNKIFTWGNAQEQYKAGDEIEIISDYRINQ